MTEDYLMIDNIPAIVLGDASDKVYLFVHGRCGSKEESLSFADIVVPNGWQVIGIDLPGHGVRADEADNFNPMHIVPELEKVMMYLREHYKKIGLRANSIGAWLCMQAFADETLVNSLFVSPILDMEKLICGMMYASSVTEAELCEKKRIPTDFGEALDWDYYMWVKSRPITDWHATTAVLYAGHDTMTDRATVDDFIHRFNCTLTVMDDGEHWFHTPEQLAVLQKWEKENTRLL